MDKEFFLITGLPRTRTAWLANLFTANNAICFHEPSNDFRSLEEMKSYFDTLPYQYVGISDSSIPFYWDFFKKIPAQKMVIVNRDENEVLNSLLKFTNAGLPVCKKMIEWGKSGLIKIKQEREFLEVDFDTLSNNNVVKRIWNYVLPMQFDIIRCQILQRMVIQQDYQKAMDTIKTKQ